MIWYLKVDRQTLYVIRNVKRWLDVISFDKNAYVYIV